MVQYTVLIPFALFHIARYHKHFWQCPCMEAVRRRLSSQWKWLNLYILKLYREWNTLGEGGAEHSGQKAGQNALGESRGKVRTPWQLSRGVVKTNRDNVDLSRSRLPPDAKPST
jgi:hypothetical protein